MVEVDNLNTWGLVQARAASYLDKARLPFEKVRRFWRSLWTRSEPGDDKLKWSEKLPLALAMTGQAFTLGLWYYIEALEFVSTEPSLKVIWWLPTLVSIVAAAAGLSLDLMVVTTAAGRRAGRDSAWSEATGFVSFACGAIIAYSAYNDPLHVAFPLVVWLYCQHISRGKRPRLPLIAVKPASTKRGKTITLASDANALALMRQIVSANGGAGPEAARALLLAGYNHPPTIAKLVGLTSGRVRQIRAKLREGA